MGLGGGGGMTGDTMSMSVAIESMVHAQQKLRNIGLHNILY